MAAPPLSLRPDRGTDIRLAIRRTVPAWIGARVLVGVALTIAHLSVHRVDDPLARVTVRQGLLAWDGAFYADIAHYGYAALPTAALRFFPLTALLGRGIGFTGLGPRIGVVVGANIAALVATVLLYSLVRREGYDDTIATRSVWLFSLGPAAFVLALGYAEAGFLACAIGIVFLMRDRRWWSVIPLGILAGLSRPGGFVVAVPIVVEAFLTVRTMPVRARAGQAAAAVSPFVGTALYLGWVHHRFGDGWLPFSIQTRASLKGSFTNPISSISGALDGMVHGRTVGTGLHVVWMAVAVTLVVLGARRLPAAYTWFSAASLASAVTSSNLDSFERYALGAFPLVIVLALLLTDRRAARAVIALSGLAMTGYATLAFLHAYVP
ncbi:MAG: hypothetical protein JJE46_02070 [Acidimicrobiia bacterium]|nr:hypothetical protein [Acidimicrobiia bacterium]